MAGIHSVKAVHHVLSHDNNPLPSRIKEDIVKQYPMLFQGLGKLEGEHTIHLKEGVTFFFLTPREGGD